MQYIKYEIEENIATITISREKALNALNTQMLIELDSVLDQVQKNKNIYCLVITGAGDKSFVAGADVNEMKDLNAMQAKEFGAFGNSVFRKLETLDIPVIAAINGYTLGGGLELALACDIRIAADNSVFGLPETGLGITPGYGGTQRLPRTIGVSAAKKLMFTGVKIKAGEAYRLGLVDEIAAQGELMQAATKLASKIAQQAPIAVANCKKAISRGIDEDMDCALAIETALFAECFATKDQKNAMDAFVCKKKLGKFENR